MIVGFTVSSSTWNSYIQGVFVARGCRGGEGVGFWEPNVALLAYEDDRKKKPSPFQWANEQSAQWGEEQSKGGYFCGMIHSISCYR